MNKQSSSTKRGIVLVTTMLSVVLTFMILSSVVYSNLGNFTLTSRFQEREIALLAAESGASYAVEKLSHDINWRGDANKVTINNSDLYVEEQNGNVIGIIQNDDGKNAAFRIKFNYEDGEDGLDGLNDTASTGKEDFLIHSTNVSVNNLSNTAETCFYNTQTNGVLQRQEKNLIQDAEAKNFTPEKTEKTLALPTDSGKVPKATCRLVVEGFADPKISKSRINEIASCENNRYTMRTLETYLTLSSIEAAQNSAAACGGSITVTNNDKFRVSAQNGSKATSINCLGNVNIVSENVDLSNGTKFYYSGTQSGLKANECEYKDVATNSKTIKNLKWDDIPKADGSNTLNSGTYVWENVAVQGQPARYKLFHYSTIDDDYSRVNREGPVLTNESKGFIVNEDELSVTITKNTYVPGNGVIFKSADSTVGTRPIVCLQQDEGSSPILTSSGIVRIDGATFGNGSITAEGNVSFQGPSILESDPGVGVSIYSKGDVNITAIDNTTQLVEKEMPSNGIDNNLEVVNPNNGSSSCYRDEFSSWLDGANCSPELKAESLRYYDSFLASLRNGSSSVQINQRNYPLLYELSNSDIMLCLSITCNASVTAYMDYYAQENGNERQDQVSIEEIKGPEYEVAEFDPGRFQRLAPENNRSLNRLNNKEAQIAQMSEAFDSDIKYADQDIAGVIYACKNINVNIGETNNLNVTGAMIAFGGDPANSLTSASNNGNININAKRVNLVSDPTYVSVLLGNSNGLTCAFQKSMFAVY